MRSLAGSQRDGRLAQPVSDCICCGSSRIVSQPVLWPQLVSDWRLSPSEAAYVDRQQGTHCADCGSNLRSMALACAILDLYSDPGVFKDFMAGSGQDLRILEINEAGNLTQFLSGSRRHCLARFPSVDMRAMTFADGSFDLVVHSDTLEHIDHPIAAMRECWRVLRPGGACAFTVPIVVDRLTSSREGLPPSYHNSANERDPSLLVHTEYGADAWRHVVEAGFPECRITALEYPCALALVGIR